MTDRTDRTDHSDRIDRPVPAEVIDTVVVGGGLAGLVAAATAAGPGRRVVLLDAHPLGGRARVDERSGFRFNRGPRALYLGGAAPSVLEALGVDLRRGGTPAVPRARARRHGRLHLLPQGPASLLRTSLLGAGDKLRAGVLLARLPGVDAAALAGTSFATYLEGLGLGDVGTDLVAMLARVATYAAEPERLDAAAVVGQVQLALRPGVRYLDGGFQVIVDQLRARVEGLGVEVRSVAASAVHPAVDGRGPSVDTAAGTLHAGTAVVAAGTPAAAAGLLGRPVVGADGLTAPVTAACLELGLRRAPVHPVVFGVGEPLYLSVHGPPADLAPPGQVVVHVMRNHAADDRLDRDAQRAWLRAAAADAGVADDDIVEERFLPRMVVSGGMPTAGAGGCAGRPAVVGPERPGVLLAGDWVGSTGLLADAAVASGAEAGRHAAARSATMAAA